MYFFTNDCAKDMKGSLNSGYLLYYCCYLLVDTQTSVELTAAPLKCQFHLNYYYQHSRWLQFPLLTTDPWTQLAQNPQTILHSSSQQLLLQLISYQLFAGIPLLASKPTWCHSPPWSFVSQQVPDSQQTMPSTLRVTFSCTPPYLYSSSRGTLSS